MQSGNSENIMDLTTVPRRDSAAAGGNSAGKSGMRPAKSIFSIRSLVEVEEDGMHNNNNNHSNEHPRNSSPRLQGKKKMTFFLEAEMKSFKDTRRR